MPDAGSGRVRISAWVPNHRPTAMAVTKRRTIKGSAGSGRFGKARFALPFAVSVGAMG
jgi:hypothetical protein